MPPTGPNIKVLQNDISLHKDSIQLKASGSDSRTLTFTYDSVFDSKVTIYCLVREKADPISDFTLGFESIHPNGPREITQHMSKGTRIQFPQNCFSMDFSKIPREVLLTRKEGEYGLVIRLEKTDPSGLEVKAMYNYCEFEEEAHQLIVKVKRQKMEWNGQAYEIQEIFGIDSSDLESKKAQATMADTNKECSVCLNDKIDTIILPCRHMCLCVGCANELAKKSAGRKCPICREPSEGFVRLTRPTS